MVNRWLVEDGFVNATVYLREPSFQRTDFSNPRPNSNEGEEEARKARRTTTRATTTKRGQGGEAPRQTSNKPIVLPFAAPTFERLSEYSLTIV
jgi:hypothetical protein